MVALPVYFPELIQPSRTRYTNKIISKPHIGSLQRKSSSASVVPIKTSVAERPVLTILPIFWGLSTPPHTVTFTHRKISETAAKLFLPIRLISLLNNLIFILNYRAFLQLLIDFFEEPKLPSIWLILKKLKCLESRTIWSLFKIQNYLRKKYLLKEIKFLKR